MCAKRYFRKTRTRGFYIKPVVTKELFASPRERSRRKSMQRVAKGARPLKFHFFSNESAGKNVCGWLAERICIHVPRRVEDSASRSQLTGPNIQLSRARICRDAKYTQRGREKEEDPPMNSTFLLRLWERLFKRRVKALSKKHCFRKRRARGSVRASATCDALYTHRDDHLLYSFFFAEARVCQEN